MARPKSSTDPQFEQSVEVSLASLRAEFCEAIASNKEPPKLSVASFTKRYNFSRSRLYGDFPHLVLDIQRMFEQIKIYEMDLRKAKKVKPRYFKLTDVNKMRDAHKKELAIVASNSLTQIIDQFHPAFRERIQLMRERQAHLQKIEELESKLVRLEALVRAQMLMLEKADAK